MKEETIMRPGDVFCVYVNDAAAFFARAEEITFDVKKGWRNLRFTVLDPHIKDRELTWILQPSQIDGEPYTMGGTPIRIERMPDPKPLADEPQPEADAEKPTGGSNVIAFRKTKENS